MSIALDPLELLAEDVERLGIQSPYLSDQERKVVEAYGIPLTHGGEPGHIFVLVGQDGSIKWVRDYSAQTMYVEPDEVYQEVSRRLA